MASAGGWTFRDTGRAHSRLLMGGAQIIEDLHQLNAGWSGRWWGHAAHAAGCWCFECIRRHPKAQRWWHEQLRPCCVSRPVCCCLHRTLGIRQHAAVPDLRSKSNGQLWNRWNAWLKRTYTSHTEWSWLICWPIWQMGLKNQPRTAFTFFFLCGSALGMWWQR